jgi:hypothetical protein
MGELHDEICKVLTWYEHPNEYPFGKEALDEDIKELMYKLLVKIDNEIVGW